MLSVFCRGPTIFFVMMAFAIFMALPQQAIAYDENEPYLVVVEVTYKAGTDVSALPEEVARALSFCGGSMLLSQTISDLDGGVSIPMSSTHTETGVLLFAVLVLPQEEPALFASLKERHSDDGPASTTNEMTPYDLDSRYIAGCAGMDTTLKL